MIAIFIGEFALFLLSLLSQMPILGGYILAHSFLYLLELELTQKKKGTASYVCIMNYILLLYPACIPLFVDVVVPETKLTLLCKLESLTQINQ